MPHNPSKYDNICHLAGRPCRSKFGTVVSTREDVTCNKCSKLSETEINKRLKEAKEQVK